MLCLLRLGDTGLSNALDIRGRDAEDVPIVVREDDEGTVDAVALGGDLLLPAVGVDDPVLDGHVSTTFCDGT